MHVSLTEKKRQDYTFQRQFSEKPSVRSGCPGLSLTDTSACLHTCVTSLHWDVEQLVSVWKSALCAGPIDIYVRQY